MCIVGAVGHDFYEGERNGSKGFPRFTDPSLRGPDDYADYLRMATERSLERCGIDRFDLLLLHNPDRIGYTSRGGLGGMAALRDAGLTRLIGVAPGPANGFTLDLIDCLERHGELLDWAMIILNPLEPWPGELVLGAAAQADVKLITRVVDYGGLFFDDLLPGQRAGAAATTAAFARRAGSRPAANGSSRCGRSPQRAGLTLIQLACQWNLAHDPVACTAPTLIQEVGPHARSIEDKRAELAALPAQLRLSDDDVATIRALGDNTGSMLLKGASPEFSGDEQPDRWTLDERLESVARALARSSPSATSSSAVPHELPADRHLQLRRGRSSRSPSRSSAPTTATAPAASAAPARARRPTRASPPAPSGSCAARIGSGPGSRPRAPRSSSAATAARRCSHATRRARVGVRLGVLDGRPRRRPSAHQFTAYAASWEAIPDDGLPRHPRRRRRRRRASAATLPSALPGRRLASASAGRGP